MKHKILIFLFVLAGCASGPSVVTMNTYADIPIGATKDEVITQAGDPLNITRNNDGSEEYEYVERMNAGGRILQERHYFIILKEGVVVSKRYEQSSPPAYSFDSYEMQTTHNIE